MASPSGWLMVSVCSHTLAGVTCTVVAYQARPPLTVALCIAQKSMAIGHLVYRVDEMVYLDGLVL